MCYGTFYEIRKFCCCGSLRIGSLIIGYLGLVGNVLQVAGVSANLHYLQSFYTQHTPIYNQYVILHNHVMAIAIAYHAMSTLFHAALIWGIHKRRSEFILPWLIVKGFECILVVIVVIVATIIYMVSPGMDIGVLFLLMAIFILCSWLVIYSFMCVFSYYRQIKSISEEKEEKEKDLPPVYIKSIFDDKNQSISEIHLTQNEV